MWSLTNCLKNEVFAYTIPYRVYFGKTSFEKVYSTRRFQSILDYRPQDQPSNKTGIIHAQSKRLKEDMKNQYRLIDRYNIDVKVIYTELIIFLIK